MAGVAGRPEHDSVLIAELAATLYYAADLGLRRLMERCMRRTVITLRLADLLDATDTDQEATVSTSAVDERVLPHHVAASRPPGLAMTSG